MTEVEFFPVTLWPRQPMEDWGMFELPDTVTPYVRIAHAVDIEPGDIVLGDAPTGAAFDGWLAFPYLAEPTEHDLAACWDCRHNMSNYRPTKPGRRADDASIRNYGYALDAVESARRHLDGGVIDVSPGVHAAVNDRMVIIPADFAATEPAVADYQAYIMIARFERCI
ncbi:hypothetical protein [Streptomyces sp. NPDC047525]|uniref:hypothetical protein n=1 Tax=Streptomyces sp. NPDC047525 TaxID=3155264 RepID=UPI0033FC6791